MGAMKINNKTVVAPNDQITVREAKALANLPANHRLYDRSGKVLEENEVIDTNETEFGVVQEWERGLT